MGSAVTRATYTSDALGRLTHQVDYSIDTGGSLVTAYDHTIAYNAGQVATDTVVQLQGSDTWSNVTTNAYGAVGTTGYALGAVTAATTVVSKNGVDAAAPDTSVANSYAWYGGAALSGTVFNPDTSAGTTYATTNTLSASGVLTSSSIAGTNARTVTFTTDALGQVVRRDEHLTSPSSDTAPHAAWLRFAGREMGHVTNDGSLDTDYAASIADRIAATGTGSFHNGQSYGNVTASFADAYVPLTSYAQGSDGGGYTAQGGETLSALAAQLWGDSALWYKLAEANGLSGDATLAAGQHLTLPAGVVRSSNTAATFKPYDPAEALGNINPTGAAHGKAKCGGFGQILVAAIAVAIVALLPEGAPLGEQIAVAMFGSYTSQVAGMAVGVQDHISLKGIAIAGLTAGISGGLDAGGVLTGGGFATQAARGALANGLTQGVALATGLQDKFDFAGFAAAGIGQGIGSQIHMGGIAGRFLHAGADGLASATTRSLIDGTDFGDNLMAVLPDVIGRTVGGWAGEAVVGQSRKGPLAATKARLDDTFVVYGQRPTTLAGIGLGFGGGVLNMSCAPSEPDWQSIGVRPPTDPKDAADNDRKTEATRRQILETVPKDQQQIWLDRLQAAHDSWVARFATLKVGALTSTASGKVNVGVSSPLGVVQWALDGISNGLSNVVAGLDAKYQALRDGLDKNSPQLANSLPVLLADAGEAFTHTVASTIANAPSALGHPIRTLVWEPAAWLDGALRAEDNGQGYQRAYAGLRNSTPRQIATGFGKTAGVITMIVVPSKFAAGRAPFLPREYAPVSEGIVASPPAETMAPKVGIQANKAAGNAIRDAIAAREAPALIEQSFTTVGGVRRVDILKVGEEIPFSIESKVGRTSLGSRERQELARDWWLLKQNRVSGVRWEFSPSGVNQGVGPSPALQRMLDKLGFETRINK